MGMPRVLKNEYNRLFNDDPRLLSHIDLDLHDSILFLAGRLGEAISICELLPQSIVEDPRQHSYVRLCTAKSAFKLLKRGSCIQTHFSNLDKISAQKYVGLEARCESHIQAQFVLVKVSRGFKSRLTKLNKIREAKDRQELKWRDSRLTFENKVYKQRTFPAKLRHIIFERDQFTCQNCGKPRSELISEGSWLEVDHKLAWEDGGETCYSNDLTLCRTCNIAKHHAKKHFYVYSHP